MVSLAITPTTSINSAVANGILSSDPSNFILVAEGAWVLTSAPAFDAILLNNNTNTTTANILSIDGTVGAIANAINGAGGAIIVIGEAGYVTGNNGIILGLASDITNAGTIIGIYTGVGLLGVNNVVTNTGLIRGTLDAGLQFVSLVGGVNTVVNSGTISGSTFGAIVCGLQDDTITNTGLLAGAVHLGNGINVLTNDGEITDLIAGGTSSDTVTNHVHGVIDGSLFLGNGSNTVTNDGTIADGIVGGNGIAALGLVCGSALAAGGASKDEATISQASSSIAISISSFTGWTGRRSPMAPTKRGSAATRWATRTRMENHSSRSASHSPRPIRASGSPINS